MYYHPSRFVVSDASERLRKARLAMRSEWIYISHSSMYISRRLLVHASLCEQEVEWLGFGDYSLHAFPLNP